MKKLLFAIVILAIFFTLSAAQEQKDPAADMMKNLQLIEKTDRRAGAGARRLRPDHRQGPDGHDGLPLPRRARGPRDRHARLRHRRRLRPEPVHPLGAEAGRRPAQGHDRLLPPRPGAPGRQARALLPAGIRHEGGAGILGRHRPRVRRRRGPAHARLRPAGRLHLRFLPAAGHQRAGRIRRLRHQRKERRLRRPGRPSTSGTRSS